MTPADFIDHLTSSKLALVGYTLMTGILLETLRISIRGLIELRLARRLRVGVPREAMSVWTGL